MSAKILDGKTVSTEILHEVSNDAERLKNKGWTPMISLDKNRRQSCY